MLARLLEQRREPVLAHADEVLALEDERQVDLVEGQPEGELVANDLHDADVDGRQLLVGAAQEGRGVVVRLLDGVCPPVALLGVLLDREEEPLCERAHLPVEVLLLDLSASLHLGSLALDPSLFGLDCRICGLLGLLGPRLLEEGVERVCEGRNGGGGHDAPF